MTQSELLFSRCIIDLKSFFLLKMTCSNASSLLRYYLAERLFSRETFRDPCPFQFSVILFPKSIDLYESLHFKDIRAN